MAQATRHCAYNNHGEVPTYQFYRDRKTGKPYGYCKDCRQEYNHLRNFIVLTGRPRKDGTRSFPDWHTDIIVAYGRPIEIKIRAALVNGVSVVQHSGMLEMSTGIFNKQFKVAKK